MVNKREQKENDPWTNLTSGYPRRAAAANFQRGAE